MTNNIVEDLVISIAAIMVILAIIVIGCIIMIDIGGFGNTYINSTISDKWLTKPTPKSIENKIYIDGYGEYIFEDKLLYNFIEFNKTYNIKINNYSRSASIVNERWRF